MTSSPENFGSQVLPKKRSLTVVIVVVVLAIIGSSVATYFLVPNLQPTWLAGNKANTSTGPNDNKNNNPVSQVTSARSGWFYYTMDVSQDNVYPVRFYRASTSFDLSDQKLYEFTAVGKFAPRIITESGKKDTVIVIENRGSEAQIFSLDIAAKNVERTQLKVVPLRKEISESISGARFLDEGSKIAYITADGQDARAEHSIMHVVDLSTKQEAEQYKLNDRSPLYAGFGFLFSSDNDSIVYLHETGGDGGAVYTTWYRIDRQQKTVKAIEGLPPDGKGDDQNPISVAFSPDGTKIAYPDFSTTIAPDDLDQRFVPCLKNDAPYQEHGGTVMVTELATQKSTELFRNLAYEKNMCKNTARRVLAVKWIDNNRLAFETVDGIYSLDLATKKTTELHAFSRTYDPGREVRPIIQFIALPLIMLSDHSVIDINTKMQLQSVNASTTDDATFFVAK